MLEKGSKTNPTGNLIVYCYVIGENPFQPGCEIIASNVVVSFLKINDNFPVVTFPPISFPSIDELKKVIIPNESMYDMARLPDFRMPEDREAGNIYIQERMEQYNAFVMKYVELCKNKERNVMPDFNLAGVNDYLDELLKISMQFRSSTGLARDTVQQRIDKLIENFSVRYPQFDLENYKNALFYPGKKGDELASLYLKKFQAINDEKYEAASIIKRKILDLETTV
jgi:hypothetical protein